MVKGTIEPGEPPEAAALRELAEESGILSGQVVRSLGTAWAFVQWEVGQEMGESWVHQVADDGGHEFRFFWHPLHEDVSVDAWLSRAGLRRYSEFVA